MSALPPRPPLPHLTPFGEYCARQTEHYGARFDCSGLRPKFVRFYNSGERIRVNVGGEVVTGTVGATGGRAPQFMLLRTSRSISSWHLLSESDTILAVQMNGRYVPVFPKES